MSPTPSIVGALATLAALIGLVLYLRPGLAAPEVDQVAIVERVIDGDTFTATTANGEDLGRIRVLGINAPEMAQDDEPEMCYAQEATAEAKRLLEGQTVQISTDPTQDQRDQYDRLLAYVDVEGDDFAEVMLGAGHVRVYRGSPLTRQNAYDDAANDAEDARAGLWGKC